VILQVNQELSRHFDGTPRAVFGPVVERVERALGEAGWMQATGLLAA
jgi:hypothetical protein